GPYFRQHSRIMRISVDQTVHQTARNSRTYQANAVYYHSRYAVTRISVSDIVDNNRILCLFAPPKSVAALDKDYGDGFARDCLIRQRVSALLDSPGMTAKSPRVGTMCRPHRHWRCR